MRAVHSPNFDHQVHAISPHEIFFSRAQIYGPDHSDIDVYGNFWSFVFADIPKPGLRIKSSGDEFAVTGPVGILIPPDEVVHWKMRIHRLDWFAYCSDRAYPSFFPKQLSVFQISSLPDEVSPAWIAGMVQSTRPIWSAHSSVANIYARKLKTQLDKEFQSNDSLDAYAEELGLSKEWLIRYFKQAYDITPIDYRNKKRLMQAFFELHTQSGKIIDLSYNLGFNDLKHFNSLFKKILQVTPSQLRS